MAPDMTGSTGRPNPSLESVLQAEIGIERLYRQIALELDHKSTSLRAGSKSPRAAEPKTSSGAHGTADAPYFGKSRLDERLVVDLLLISLLSQPSLGNQAVARLPDSERL